MSFEDSLKIIHFVQLGFLGRHLDIPYGFAYNQVQAQVNLFKVPYFNGEYEIWTFILYNVGTLRQTPSYVIIVYIRCK